MPPTFLSSAPLFFLPISLFPRAARPPLPHSPLLYSSLFPFPPPSFLIPIPLLIPVIFPIFPSPHPSLFPSSSPFSYLRLSPPLFSSPPFSLSLSLLFFPPPHSLFPYPAPFSLPTTLFSHLHTPTSFPRSSIPPPLSFPFFPAALFLFRPLPIFPSPPLSPSSFSTPPISLLNPSALPPFPLPVFSLFTPPPYFFFVLSPFSLPRASLIALPHFSLPTLPSPIFPRVLSPLFFPSSSSFFYLRLSFSLFPFPPPSFLTPILPPHSHDLPSPRPHFFLSPHLPYPSLIPLIFPTPLFFFPFPSSSFFFLIPASLHPPFFHSSSIPPSLCPAPSLSPPSPLPTIPTNRSSSIRARRKNAAPPIFYGNFSRRY